MLACSAGAQLPLRSHRATTPSQLDALKAKREEVATQLDTLRSKESEARSDVPGLIAERKEASEIITALRKKQSEIREAFNAKWQVRGRSAPGLLGAGRRERAPPAQHTCTRPAVAWHALLLPQLSAPPLVARPPPPFL